MVDYFNNKSIFYLINKWKFHIVSIVIITVIISGAASYLVTPLFKSTAILYPTNLFSFSDENETEQMLQYLKSNDIKLELIENLNLAKHYKIDKSDKLFKTYMFYRLQERISFKKTEFESVKISVLDQDPKMAVNIVNEIIRLYNKKAQTIHRIKYKELLLISASLVERKIIELDSLESRALYMRNEYGILDYKNQIKELTRVYYKSKSTKQVNEAKRILDNISKYGGEYKSLDDKISKELKTLTRLRYKYENVNAKYNKNITFAQIIEKPFTADKKTKPVRWAIVLLSVIGVLVLVMIVISIIEKKEKQ